MLKDGDGKGTTPNQGRCAQQKAGVGGVSPETADTDTKYGDHKKNCNVAVELRDRWRGKQLHCERRLLSRVSKGRYISRYVSSCKNKNKIN